MTSAEYEVEVDRLVYNLCGLAEVEIRVQWRGTYMGETVITEALQNFDAQLQEQMEYDELGFLYRGQADAIWPVNCSAVRRLTQDPANPDRRSTDKLSPYRLPRVSHFQKPECAVFFHLALTRPPPTWSYLAQLQHQGAATGLIDFTRQPFVALWFACNEHTNRDGAVYVLSRSATEEISNRRDLEKQIQSFYEEGTLWSWEPSALGNRIVAQSSVFVLGVPAIASRQDGRGS